jgi:hypothetical protein
MFFENLGEADDGRDEEFVRNTVSYFQSQQRTIPIHDLKVVALVILVDKCTARRDSARGWEPSPYGRQAPVKRREFVFHWNSLSPSKGSYTHGGLPFASEHSRLCPFDPDI